MMNYKQTLILVGLSIITILGCENKKLTEATEALKYGHEKEAREKFTVLSEQSGTSDIAKVYLLVMDEKYDEAYRLCTKQHIDDCALILARGALGVSRIIENNDIHNDDALQASLSVSAHYYQELTKYGTSNANIYLELGFLYFKLVEYKKAKLTFKKALLIKENFPEALLGLGKTCFARLEYDDAILAFNKALDYDHHYYEAKVGLGEVYAFLDDFKNAERSYLDAISIDSKNDAAYLGLSIISLKQKKWDQSVNYYKKYKFLVGKNTKT